MKNIILASQSPRRKLLLQQIGLEFTCWPARIKEDIPDLEAVPEDFARELALRKAQTVGQVIDKGLVIAADTIVVLEGKVLGKPSSQEDAFGKLSLLSGRSHEVITGVCVMDGKSKKVELDTEISRVFFRKLSEAEIKNYIASKEPMDKAGAYGIQGLGAVLINRIEGCYSNVVGLPLSRLYLMLKKQGIDVLRGNQSGAIHN